MKLEREISYLVTEGTFAGTIINAKLITVTRNDMPRENLRLTIAVDPIHNDFLHDYRVRADYWGNQQDGLIRDLFAILGSDVMQLVTSEGEIIPEQMHILEGKRVRFDVTHESRPGFDVPFRKVRNLRPIPSTSAGLKAAA